MSAKTETAAPIAPTTKRESALFAGMPAEQQEAARVIAATSDKLTAAVWKAAIQRVLDDAAKAAAAAEPKEPSKTQLAREAREAKKAEAAANAEAYGVFTIQEPTLDDELFAVVMNGTHIVYTATNRRYVEVVSRALADGLAARVASVPA